MTDSSTMASSRARQDGYLDGVYSIFEAHHHPVVVVEDGAMRWMGLRVCPEENLDLLVRDSQADTILTGLLATGCFERVDQDIGFRFEDPYTKQVPRLRDMRCAPGPFSCINLWTEAVYMLRVEAAEPVAVMDIHAWNVNLVEERFATVPETACITFTAQTERGPRILPKILSSARGVPIFVPSIPKICDAVLDQHRYRTTHAGNFQRKKGNRPAYHLCNFVRYLYLERQSQRELLLPLLAERNRAEMEQIVNAFKRKPTLAMIKERTTPARADGRMLYKSFSPPPTSPAPVPPQTRIESPRPRQALISPQLLLLLLSPPPPPPHAMPDIGPGQKAALSEAYAATVLLLPSSLRAEFPVIGGASLVILGSKRKTEDVDFAASAAALSAFEEATCNNPRFSKGAVAEWTYSCQGEGIEDVKVSLEFLQMGGGFAPNIKVVKPVGEGFRAGMGELVRMKSNTYTARGEDKNLENFCFLLDKMEETGEGFEGVELEEEDLESMEATAADCGGWHLDLLKELFKKAGH